MRKPVEQMTHGDIENEIEHLEGFFEECARMECGISTKDTVRMRNLRMELARRTSETAIAA